MKKYYTILYFMFFTSCVPSFAQGITNVSLEGPQGLDMAITLASGKTNVVHLRGNASGIAGVLGVNHSFYNQNYVAVELNPAGEDNYEHPVTKKYEIDIYDSNASLDGVIVFTYPGFCTVDEVQHADVKIHCWRGSVTNAIYEDFYYDFKGKQMR